MPKLKLFGGVVLEGATGPIRGRAVQRRRLAILMLLAAAPGRTMSRDKLIAYLWPESGADAGRHLLSGALYELRKALGEGAILASGDDVRLEAAVLHVDAVAFDEALATDDAERAVALYAGPFADGFFVTGAPGFDEWLEHTRERYRRSWLAELESLAEARSAAGDVRGAVDMWRRLVDDDGASTRNVVGLMRALVAAGNPAGALHAARAHAAHVRSEYDVDPDPAVLELAQRIRSRGGEAPADAMSAAAFPATPVSVNATRAPDDDVVRREPAAELAAMAAPRTVVTVVALALLVAVASGIASLASRDRAAALAVSDSRIAVLPFGVRTSPEFAYLGAGMSDLLSTGLDGAGEIRTVKPEALLGSGAAMGADLDPTAALALARRFGAGASVVGTVIEVERRLHIRAALYRHGDGLEPVAEAAVEGDVFELFSLVDALAAALLEANGAAPGLGGRGIAARTTHSLPALKEYLIGERDYRAGRYVPAADAFARSVAHDSTFALAHYRLSLAALAADRPGTYPADADARAWRHAERLGERDRRMLEAYMAWRRGSADAAERLYREAVAAYPTDVDAWYQLGETLFHYNPLRGRPLAEARAPFARVLALDPDRWGALLHLVEVAARQGEVRETRRLLARLRRLAPSGGEALEVRTLEAIANRDAGALRRLEPELAAADENILSRILWRTAVYFGDLDEARRIGGLLTQPHRNEYARMTGHSQLAFLELAAGRLAAADAALDAVAALDASRWHEFAARVALAVAPLGADRTDGIAALRDTIAAHTVGAGPPHPATLYLLGLLSAAIADTAAVVEHAAGIERALDAVEPLDREYNPLTGRPDVELRGYAGTLRALAARAGGRPEEALAILQGSHVDRWYGLAISSPLHARDFDRFLRAELLHELGRYDEALSWYASFGEHALHDLVYLAPAHLRSAEIHERLGDLRAARGHYAAALRIWRDADPELDPVLDHVRRRLVARDPLRNRPPGHPR
jgi:DNA-binding SARP family transcriptional activator